MSSEAIVVALECVVLETETPVQSGAARRQAAYRERLKERNTLRNVDNDVTVKKGFDKEIPHTPLEITSQKITTSRAKAVKSDLPDDFQPNSKTWEVADECGFTEREVFGEIEKMRDWAKNADGGKGRKADWDAALRNWLKRAANDRRNRPQAHSKPSVYDSFAILDAVTDEAIRRRSGRSEEGDEINPERVSERKSAA